MLIEEYGLIAFHPPSLYLKTNSEISDKMALYYWQRMPIILTMDADETYKEAEIFSI